VSGEQPPAPELAATGGAAAVAAGGSLRALRRMRLLFEQMPGFLCLLSGPDHVFELANAAYRRLVGPRDLIGRTVRDALPEVEGQGFFELLDRTLATREPFIGQALPVRLRTAPDEPLTLRYVDFIYQPIVEEDGTVSGIITEGQDVTDRVLALQQAEALAERNDVIAREMSHRMLNSLHMVESVLLVEVRRQAPVGPAREALERARQRVHAMALVHRFVYQVDHGIGSTLVGMAEYLRSVTDEITSAFGAGRCTVTTEADQGVRIEASKATTIGMLVTELAINASKYAYADGVEGRVLVRLTALGDRCTVSVEDDGAGLPEGFNPGSSKGLGMRLVTSFARQLKGHLAVERLPRGTRFAVTFPI
jgi:two-component sensor histidine kinase